MDESLIIDLWDLFKEYIPEKSRDTAATQFTEFLMEQDVTIKTLEGVLGYDHHLDQAINLIIAENTQEEDEDEDWEYDQDIDED